MSDSIISFAAFILADAGLEITSDNLLTITKAAGANVDNVCTKMQPKTTLCDYEEKDQTTIVPRNAQFWIMGDRKIPCNVSL